MGRKGDITSKVIGVRAPIKIVTKLMNEASDKGISLSEYCVSLLAKDNFSQGGQPINIRVPIDNPILIKEIEKLNKELLAYGNLIASLMHIDEVVDVIKKNTDISFVSMNTDEMKKMFIKQYEIGKQIYRKKS